VSFILTVNTMLCQQLNCEITEIETGRRADCNCPEENNTDNSNYSENLISIEELLTNGNNSVSEIEIRNCTKLNFANKNYKQAANSMNVTFKQIETLNIQNIHEEELAKINDTDSLNEVANLENKVVMNDVQADSAEDKLSTNDTSPRHNEKKTALNTIVLDNNYEEQEDKFTEVVEIGSNKNSDFNNIIFFYLTIALGIFSGLLVVVIVVLVICLRLNTGRKDKTNKQVSRAESWRYESSIYIKPPTAHQTAQCIQNKQIVHPSPHLPFTTPRSAAPSSLTNSPLMRHKQNQMATAGFRGVDIVRTHMTRPQPQDDISYHRVRNDTYHGNQEVNEPKLQPGDFQRNETYHGNFQEFSDTDYALSQTSDSENEDDERHNSTNNECETSTLPYR